jgi:ribose 5-phosphate isomerase B
MGSTTQSLAVASDHGGLTLKEELVLFLKERGHAVTDLGVHSAESVDYPDYARKVAEKVTSGDADLGLLVCGTGVGMSIAANKVAGVRAAVVSDTFSARMSRAHNNANILCLGERVVGPGLARELLTTWLETPFEGGRHERRVTGIHSIESQT